MEAWEKDSMLLIFLMIIFLLEYIQVFNFIPKIIQNLISFFYGSPLYFRHSPSFHIPPSNIFPIFHVWSEEFWAYESKSYWNIQ